MTSNTAVKIAPFGRWYGAKNAPLFTFIVEAVETPLSNVKKRTRKNLPVRFRMSLPAPQINLRAFGVVSRIPRIDDENTWQTQRCSIKAVRPELVEGLVVHRDASTGSARTEKVRSRA